MLQYEIPRKSINETKTLPLIKLSLLFPYKSKPFIIFCISFHRQLNTCFGVFFAFVFHQSNRIGFSANIFKRTCKTAAFSSQLQL